MQSIKQKEIPTVNQLIRIKDKDLDFPLAFFHTESMDWGLELIYYFPTSGKIIDATFRLVDLHKFMLFLIKHPVKYYPI